MTKLETLKKRQEFAAVKQHGQRVHTPLFILQAYSYNGPLARWGFIITKKVGPAVVRNLIRRRLKEIIRHKQPHKAMDYIIVAKPDIQKVPFATLEKEFHMALYKIRATKEHDTETN